MGREIENRNLPFVVEVYPEFQDGVLDTTVFRQVHSGCDVKVIKEPVDGKEPTFFRRLFGEPIEYEVYDFCFDHNVKSESTTVRK